MGVTGCHDSLRNVHGSSRKSAGMSKWMPRMAKLRSLGEPPLVLFWCPGVVVGGWIVARSEFPLQPCFPHLSQSWPGSPTVITEIRFIPVEKFSTLSCGCIPAENGPVLAKAIIDALTTSLTQTHPDHGPDQATPRMTALGMTSEARVGNYSYLRPTQFISMVDLAT